VSKKTILMFLKLANPIYSLKNGKEWCNTGEIEGERDSGQT
jgi:hypothetical protein